MPRILDYDLIRCPVVDLVAQVAVLTVDNYEPLGSPTIIEARNEGSGLFEMIAYQAMVKRNDQ